MSDAKRSDKKYRFRDIGLGFTRRVAAAFSEGAEKYEKDLNPWEKNWKKGGQSFYLDAMDHLFEHVFWANEKIHCALAGIDFYQHALELTGDPDVAAEAVREDHLGHAGANLVMLDYFERLNYLIKNNNLEKEPEPDPTSNENESGQLKLNFGEKIELGDPEYLGEDPKEDLSWNPTQAPAPNVDPSVMAEVVFSKPSVGKKIMNLLGGNKFWE